MLGVLQKALGRHAVAGGIGIPGKLAVALEDMVGGAADLHVGAVGIAIPVRPASAATTAAATHIAVAVRTAALGTAARLTLLVDRKSVVWGTRVSVRVDLGGSRVY